MSPLDLGAPVAEEGRCPRCSLDQRPLWALGDVVACASCMTRIYPGRELTFHGGVEVVTAAQLTLI